MSAHRINALLDVLRAYGRGELPNKGSDAHNLAKRFGFVARDSNGNTRTTRKGREFLALADKDQDSV
ncbi:MAG: hypothetical protein JKY94_16875 [Rhodobacteraceae bacterium]|nr:hypothetical protein [Paracoccaceae bacterium]